MTTEAIGWYASIFLWLFATGIGIPPVPEEVGILYAAGVNALHPAVKWYLAWPACGLGVLAADCALYGLGRWWGPRLFEYRWVQRVIKKERRLRIEKRFHQHGIKLLLAARLLPPLRTGVFLIAGASRFSFLRFLFADAIYCIVGVGIFFFCGTGLLDLIHRAGSVILWVVAVPLIGYGLYRYYCYLRRCDGKPEAPVSVAQSPGDTVPDGQPVKNPAGAPAAMREAKTALEG